MIFFSRDVNEVLYSDNKHARREAGHVTSAMTNSAII